VQVEDLLKLAFERNGSDLHLVVGMPPCIRIDGRMVPTDFPAFAPQDIQKILFDVLLPEQTEELSTRWELDFSHSISGFARFRGNVIVQRGTFAAAFRVVPFKVHAFRSWGFLPTLSGFAPCQGALFWLPDRREAANRPLWLP
jgi:twitching motility protein PilT